MRARMRLEGAKELQEALRELPGRVAKSAVKRALLKSLGPIAQDAQGRAPAKSGRLQRRVTVSATLSRRQRRGGAAAKGEAAAYVGAGPARHAHLVEFGSGPRRHRKSGKSTGQMPARPFLRPAWEAGKRQALGEFGRLLWAEIDKAARRLAKRAAKGG